MRFRPRFSLMAILLTVTLVCIGLAAWKFYAERQRQRQLCDQLVGNVLLSKHWIASSDNRFKTVAELFANELIPRSDYVLSVLHPDGTIGGGNAADKFEKQILSEWLNVPRSAAPATPETAEVASLLDRSFVYYKAVRAQQICIKCHEQVFGATVGIGDLIGIMKIELTN